MGLSGRAGGQGKGSDDQNACDLCMNFSDIFEIGFSLGLSRKACYSLPFTFYLCLRISSKKSVSL